MNRVVVMVELDGDADTAAERLAAVCPDARVWGDVDPVEAALLVIGDVLPAA
jgi:hypothetical protein